jgi:hypothetical protein
VFASEMLDDGVDDGVQIHGGYGRQRQTCSERQKMALFTLGIAFQIYLNALEKESEVVAGITDVAMNAFVMESTLSPHQEAGAKWQSELAAEIAEALSMFSMTSRRNTGHICLSRMFCRRCAVRKLRRVEAPREI